ncbi:MAG: glycosyltransferase family 4 protein [Candidatus Acidiferrales bacterium]
MSLARGLLKQCLKCDGEKVEITVVTNTPAGGMDDSVLPFRVVRRPGLFQLGRLVRESDVLDLAGASIPPMALSLLLGKPFIVEHHGYQSCCPNGILLHQPDGTICPNYFFARRYGECFRCNAKGVGRARSALQIPLLHVRRWLCRRASVNVAVSQHVGGRIDLPRTTTIFNGGCSAGSPIERRAIAAPPFLFAYLGRLVPEKGVSVLLNAAALLLRQTSEFRIRIIGDGPERKSLEELSHRLGLAANIVFTGYLQGNPLQDALADAIAIAMPSTWEEPAGMTAIEQMMQGRLIIASKIGGLGEMVGDAGLLFEAGNSEELKECLARVMKEPALAAELGRKAQVRARELFEEERTVAEHWSVYRRVTAPPARKGESLDADPLRK